MTVAPLVFPSSRGLAGWWPHLAPRHPQAVWIGHLLLHHVEALVHVERPSPLDRFTQLVLQAVTLQRPGTASAADSLQQLEEQLRLGKPFIQQILQRLQADGLAHSRQAHGWQLTELGKQSLRRGSFTRGSQERRVFHFLESGSASRPPQFLNLPPTTGEAWLPSDTWSFDPGLLVACLHQPDEWKEREGFPVEVRSLLAPGEESGRNNEGRKLKSAQVPTAVWQHIIVDRPQRLTLIFILVRDLEKGEQLLGFALRPENWELRSLEPVLQRGADWRSVYPELTEDPSLDTWQQAWRAWCQPRGLHAAEVDACKLQREQHRLLVAAPNRLLQRLRAERSEALKGETWLLAGRGRVRSAVVVELREMIKPE